MNSCQNQRQPVLKCWISGGKYVWNVMLVSVGKYDSHLSPWWKLPLSLACGVNCITRKYIMNSSMDGNCDLDCHRKASILSRLWTCMGHVNHHDYQDKLKKTQSICCDSETSRLYIRWVVPWRFLQSYASRNRSFLKNNNEKGSSYWW